MCYIYRVLSLREYPILLSIRLAPTYAIYLALTFMLTYPADYNR